MADDCTYNDVPIYGGVNAETPQIDKLATEGITFSKAYVTMSMCVPCQAELYTGMQPTRNSVCWNHSIARTGLKSIVHHLDEPGYSTGVAGKFHAKPRNVFPLDMVNGVDRNCVSETERYNREALRRFIVQDREDLPEYLAETKETRIEFK